MGWIKRNRFWYEHHNIWVTSLTQHQVGKSNKSSSLLMASMMVVAAYNSNRSRRG